MLCDQTFLFVYIFSFKARVCATPDLRLSVMFRIVCHKVQVMENRVSLVGDLVQLKIGCDMSRIGERGKVRALSRCSTDQMENTGTSATEAS